MSNFPLKVIGMLLNSLTVLFLSRERSCIPGYPGITRQEHIAFWPTHNATHSVGGNRVPRRVRLRIVAALFFNMRVRRYAEAELAEVLPAMTGWERGRQLRLLISNDTTRTLRRILTWYVYAQW